MRIFQLLIEKFKSFKFRLRKESTPVHIPSYHDIDDDVAKLVIRQQNVRNEILKDITEPRLIQLTFRQIEVVEQKSELLNIYHSDEDLTYLKELNYKIELLQSNKELQRKIAYKIIKIEETAVCGLIRELNREPQLTNILERLDGHYIASTSIRTKEKSNINTLKDELLNYSLINVYNRREEERKEAERVLKEQQLNEEFTYHIQKAKKYLEDNAFELCFKEIDFAGQKCPHRHEIEKIKREAFSKKNEIEKTKSQFETIIKNAESAFHGNQLDRAFNLFTDAKLLNYDNALCDKRIKDTQNKIKRNQQLEEDKKKIEQEKVDKLIKYKIDAEEIISYFEQNGIHVFYHYTDSRNINSIIQNNGLFSINEMTKRNIHFVQGSETREMPDYVRLSYTEKHPLMYVSVSKNRIISPKVLKIDLKVATFENTRFTNVNAARTRSFPTVIIGKDLQFIKNHVKINVVKKRTHFDISADDQPYYQAEIMIERYLPTDYILNL